MNGSGCGSHAGLGAELRAVAVLALDRLGPLLDDARAERPPGAGEAASGRRPQSPEVCAVCPVCAVVALLRGERPELGVRLAEHAAGLVAVLQAALHEGDPARRSPSDGAGPDGAAHTHAPRSGPVRRVQRIRVDRPAPARP
jgi:hypothetical protein